MDMSLGKLQSWGWTGRPDVLQFMELQRAGHDWVTELNWTELCSKYAIRLLIHERQLQKKKKDVLQTLSKGTFELSMNQIYLSNVLPTL